MNSSADSGETSSENTFEDVLCERFAWAKYASNAPRDETSTIEGRTYGAPSLSEPELDDSEVESVTSSSSTNMTVMEVSVVVQGMLVEFESRSRTDTE